MRGDVVASGEDERGSEGELGAESAGLRSWECMVSFGIGGGSLLSSDSGEGEGLRWWR